MTVIQLPGRIFGSSHVSPGRHAVGAEAPDAELDWSGEADFHFPPDDSPFGLDASIGESLDAPARAHTPGNLRRLRPTREQNPAKRRVRRTHAKAHTPTEAVPLAMSTHVDIAPAPSAAEPAAEPASAPAHEPASTTRQTANWFYASAVILMLTSCVTGAESEIVPLPGPLGLRAPHIIVWEILAALLAVAATAIRFLPPYVPYEPDTGQAERDRRFREVMDETRAEAVQADFAPAPTREKSLAEIGLEAALQQAEKELEAAKAAGTSTQPPAPAQGTLSFSQVQAAISTTLGNSPADSRLVLQEFTSRLYTAIRDQQERNIA